MDEIEAGFAKIVEKIEQAQKAAVPLAETIRAHDAALLERMIKTALPVVRKIGFPLLQKAKQDTKGEPYDAGYYSMKMIILGKSEPAPFRPDNAAKKIDDQFCVLSEEGILYELMYSTDGFVMDSYLNPLDAKTALDIYGYDVMYMLYKAMHDYLKGEESLVAALDATLAYVFAEKSVPP